tara:strand:- start:4910 stop:5065 length:156 start_codon:yes stop_codon:yes gene_type:complete
MTWTIFFSNIRFFKKEFYKNKVKLDEKTLIAQFKKTKSEEDFAKFQLPWIL